MPTSNGKRCWRRWWLKKEFYGRREAPEVKNTTTQQQPLSFWSGFLESTSLQIYLEILQVSCQLGRYRTLHCQTAQEVYTTHRPKDMARSTQKDRAKKETSFKQQETITDRRDYLSHTGPNTQSRQLLMFRNTLPPRERETATTRQPPLLPTPTGPSIARLNSRARHTIRSS